MARIAKDHISTRTPPGKPRGRSQAERDSLALPASEDAPLRFLALADGFEQGDARGDGDVEAFELAGHGDAGQVVAVFASEPTQAVGLAAHHQGDVAGEVQAVKR